MKVVASPVAGRVVSVLVGASDAVAFGQTVVVLESGGRKIAVPAEHAGRVTELRVADEQQVAAGDVLLVLAD